MGRHSVTKATIYRLGERMPSLPADGNCYVAPGAAVIGDVRLASGTSIWFNAVLRGDNEPITIGKGSNVQDGCVIHTDPGYPVEIGEDVTIGHNAIIHGCSIGNGSLVGMGATVLNGARIGERCLVGANSLVREGMVVPDGSLVIGVPAKIVRQLDAEAAAKLSQGAVRYRSKAETYPLELEAIDP
ncbi:gamma carbonic anhydrase family protein [Aminobacter aganoensis]|uniref:Carbonic anhydrase/acetyltransferase-like protein (Isoleucine patch superfamily) n=1 Tax=Aminobacter aganoensis TaxID=83264 RepID=A0A7X0F713_9HYPH|nr:MULTISPECIES: gamma carbonic anhydrase family protein [Aminobacter]KQU64177.1 hypothetical protein ASC75_13550 [Aminobacter sp. DSM 101952]MBB6354288.1 carbonic anhydrase/acetyltransferase-like protein (isoleucine patch superfamily) [Aminobacter aganoensis]